MGNAPTTISICPEIDPDFMTSLPLAALVVDRDCRILKMNQTALKYFRNSSEPNNSQPVTPLKTDSLAELSPNLTDSCSELFKKEEITPLSVEAWTQDIGSFSLKIHACLFPSQLDNQKRLLLLLQETRQQPPDRSQEPDLSSLIANLPGVAYRCRNDRHWTMEFISEGCLELTGYHARDLIGNKKTSFTDITHPAHREEIWNQVQEALTDKTDFSLVFRIITAEGREKWVMEKGHGLWDPQGELICLEGFISDISEQKEAEENRRKIDAQLQKVQRLESLGVLAGGIAHDFNNLLVGVLGNAGLALYELPQETKAHKFVLKIEEAARRLAELTNQLLAYSGKGKFVVMPLCLNKVIKDMEPLLGTVAGKNVELHYDLAKDLPEIEADTAQVRQVVVNLLSNAAESITQTGEIKLKTDYFTADQNYLDHTYLNDNLKPGTYVSLKVTDTGSGMDQATIGKIFDPFFSTKFQGRGLGLAAVLGIVRSHKGAVKVHSRPGQGTKVEVLLPSSQEGTSSAEVTNNWPRLGARPKTVLVVDDEPMVLDVAQGALKRSGISVITACDGLEGLKIFKAHTKTIDLVLLDMTMPRMDGGALFEKILDLKKDAKIIISSGFSRQEASRRFRNSSLAGFIQKPYLPSQLVKLVNKALTQ